MNTNKAPNFRKIYFLVTTNHIEDDGYQHQVWIDMGSAVKSRRAAQKLAKELTKERGHEYFVVETREP